MKPKCWKCGRFKVLVEFRSYKKVYCESGCKIKHRHWKEVPTHTLICLHVPCGNKWIDGSGTFTNLVRN